MRKFLPPNKSRMPLTAKLKLLKNPFIYELSKVGI